MLCSYETIFGPGSSRDRLPVAAVSATVAAITAATAAASAATTTAMAAAPATTTAAVWTTTASAASTFTLRTRFIDHQRPAAKFLAVQCRDGLFGFRVILDFRKAKTAGLSGKAIAKQSERIGLHASFRE
jgi:hypothetical protein